MSNVSETKNEIVFDNLLIRTCTIVSWTFRSFYEKKLLQYERHRTQNRELQHPIVPPPGFSSVDNEPSLVAPVCHMVMGQSYIKVLDGSGVGLEMILFNAPVVRIIVKDLNIPPEQHLLGYGEVAEPIVKKTLGIDFHKFDHDNCHVQDKSAYNTPKRAKI
ncbi:hypothetical protein H5410_061628 [Solanum commersonii]|uniref:Uncharacterized protein n=1 Tax=Solanum commersonii TaxID=4109 RepID=A0A9J5WA70_SOLCO|nr:hypothetical protein H5410_061628 [Solanum commersonii]